MGEANACQSPDHRTGRAVKLTRKVAYAIQVLLHLAHVPTDVPVSGSALAYEGRMSERYLLSVLRSLVSRGLVRSMRGADGGYCLARSPKLLTLLDIVDTFDNPLGPQVEDFDSQPAAIRDRVLETLIRASDAARKELERLTIADLRDVRRT